MVSILSADGTQPRGMADRDQAVPYESAGMQAKRWLHGVRQRTTELQLHLDTIELAKNRRYERSRSTRAAQVVNPRGGMCMETVKINFAGR